MKKKLLWAAAVAAVIAGLVIGWNYLPARFRIPVTLTGLVCLPVGFAGGVFVRRWWEKHVTSGSHE